MEAVGLEPCKREIHLSAWNDSFSLLSITMSQSRQFPGTVMSGTSRICVARLADILGTTTLALPAMLKFDVQDTEPICLGVCGIFVCRIVCLAA